MWRFGNSNWSPTLQDKLSRDARTSSESVSEFPIGETLSPQTATIQPRFKPQSSTLVFTGIEETRINQR